MNLGMPEPEITQQLSLTWETENRTTLGHCQ
jgi:hypothetical protein